MYAFTLTKTGREIRSRRTLKPACVSLHVRALCAYEFACSCSCSRVLCTMYMLQVFLSFGVLCRDLCLWDIRRFFFFRLIPYYFFQSFLRRFVRSFLFPFSLPTLTFFSSSFLFNFRWFCQRAHSKIFRCANSILRIHGNSNDMVMLPL